MNAFWRENLRISASQTARRSTGSRAARGVPASPSERAIRSAISSTGRLLPLPTRTTFSVEDVRKMSTGDGVPVCDDDDRDSRVCRLLQHALVVLVGRAGEDVDERRGALDLAFPDGGGNTAAGQLPTQHRDQLARARDHERAVAFSGGAELLEDAEDRAGLDRGLVSGLTRAPAVRGRGRARRSPGARRSRSRFATIDEPPTLTIGSGMPVTGAIPIVIPTLTKIWNRNANTIPPAAIAEKASRAVATTFSPRQTTSR